MEPPAHLLLLGFVRHLDRVAGFFSRKLRDVLPGPQTLSLGLSLLPAPDPGPVTPIGYWRAHLPSNANRFFSDWLTYSLVTRVRLKGGEEGLEPSPATKHRQPEDTEHCVTTYTIKIIYYLIY